MAVLYGTQGIGKTETALSYSQAFPYMNTVWLDCSSEEVLNTSLAQYMETQQFHVLPSKARAALPPLLKHLRNALLIFDDANDKEIQEWILNLPREHCQYLITTYSPICFQQPYMIPIDRLTESEGEALFLQMLPPSMRNQDSKEVAELIEFCYGIPLAIRQAAAYIGKTQCSLRDYMNNLYQEKVSPESLDIGSDNISYTGKEHPGVFATFQLSYARIVKKGRTDHDYKIAEKILQFTALLNHWYIKESFFRNLDPDFLSNDTFDRGFSIVSQFGLLYRSNGLVYAKGIIQEVIRSCTPESILKIRINSVAEALTDNFSQIDLLTWRFDETTSLLLHISHIQSLKAYRMLSSSQIAFFLCKIAEFQFVINAYEECEETYQKVERMDEGIDGIRAQIGLAQLYETLQNTSSVLSYFQKLKSQESMLKKEYPEDYAHYLLIKGFANQTNGNVIDSLTFFEEAKQIVSDSSMDAKQKDYEWMRIWNGMGNSFLKMNRIEEAKECFSKAISHGQKLCHTKETKFPLLISIESNYADILVKEGKSFQKAEGYYKKEEEIYQNWSKQWQNRFAIDMSNTFCSRYHESPLNYAINQYQLACLYIQWDIPDHYEKALSYMIHARELAEQSSSSDHQIHLSINTYICLLYEKLKDYSKLIEYGEAVLQKDYQCPDPERTKRQKLLIYQSIIKSYQELRNWNKAIETTKQAIALAKTFNPPQPKELYELYGELITIKSMHVKQLHGCNERGDHT